jgi:hypothetical protein
MGWQGDSALRAAEEAAAARWGEITRRQAAQLLRLVRSLAEVGASALVTAAIAHAYGDQQLLAGVIDLAAQHMRTAAARAYPERSDARRRLLHAVARAVDRRGYSRFQEAFSPWEHGEGNTEG